VPSPPCREYHLAITCLKLTITITNQMLIRYILLYSSAVVSIDIFFTSSYSVTTNLIFTKPYCLFHSHLIIVLFIVYTYFMYLYCLSTDTITLLTVNFISYILILNYGLSPVGFTMIYFKLI